MLYSTGICLTLHKKNSRFPFLSEMGIQGIQQHAVFLQVTRTLVV